MLKQLGMQFARVMHISLNDNCFVTYYRILDLDG